MSLPLRIVLLAGCALVASLEAPEAGAWLSAGISGAYAPPAPRSETPTAWTAVVPGGLALAPVLFSLAPVPLAFRPTLALGR